MTEHGFSPTTIDPDDLAWLDAPESGCRPAELPFLALEETFVSGDASGRRLSVRYFRREADDTLTGKVLFGPGTQGPPDHAHGGSMAALMDEAMGGAAWQAGHPVVAAQLNLKFSAMLPLGARCVIEAEVTEVRGRKVRTRAVLRAADGDTIYCEGEGLFIVLNPDRIQGLSDKAQIIVDRMRKREDESI